MKTCRMLFVCLGMVIAANGCGKSSPEVKGTITYQGKILTAGEVRFFGAELSRTALIGADGVYAINDCPPGAVKVAVISIKSSGAAPAIGKKGDSSSRLATPVSAIPTKYNDPATSGLAYGIKAGSQEIDIKLED